jgi:hypothetical protein
VKARAGSRNTNDRTGSDGRRARRDRDADSGDRAADAGRIGVGVVVSLFQALTQIQETTLVFVPKILAIFVTLLIALPFMADALYANFLRIAAHITGG